MYQFRLTIGDWSEDGHGKHEDFLIESTAPVEQVREAHFRIEAATGVNIEDICSNYGEDEIDGDTFEALQQMGFTFEDSTGMGPEIINVNEMARLWLFLLQKADPTLELRIVEETVPTLHLCGYDKKKRHIGSVGYGLFR